MDALTLSPARPAGSKWAARTWTLLLAGLALLATRAALAQTNFSVGPNLVDISKTLGNETGPCIAIDPLSPSNMVVVAEEDGTAPGIFLALTTNMGATWNTNIIATNGDAQLLDPAYGDPSVAWDSYGNLYLAYLPSSLLGIAVAVSTNGGGSFSSLTNLAALDVTDQPRITAPPGGAAAGSVWVVYKDYTTLFPIFSPLQVQGMLSTGPGAIGPWNNTLSNAVASGSLPAGPGALGTFGLPLVVPQSTGGGYADMAVGPLGQVMVAFQDNLEGLPDPTQYPRANIWVSVETNAVAQGVLSSNGFGPAVLVASDAIGGVTYLAAAPTGIGVNAAPGLGWDYDGSETNYDKAYLIYTAVGPNGNAVISLMSSSDYGTNTNDFDSNWSAAIYVDDDATNGFNDHFLPRMAVDPTTGIVGCSWYDCRNDQGANSPVITITTMTNFVFSSFTATNVYFTNVPPQTAISETWTDTSGGQGTAITITIDADNVYGTLMTSSAPDTNDNDIFISGASSTNFIMDVAGTGTTNPVSAIVTVILTDTFTDAYTTGTGSNKEAIMYTTLSYDGGQSFLANLPLTPTNQNIVSPAKGVASYVVGSDSLTGWGRSTGMAAYGANFFPVWADNSDVTTDNPDGAATNFDIYMLNSGAGLPGIFVPVANLSIWVTNFNTNPVISEEVISYSVIVTNHGPKAAAPVWVTNILSPDVTLVPSGVIPALGGTYSIGQTTNGQEEIIFTWPSLPPNTVLTNTIRVAATTSSLDTNFASVYTTNTFNLFPTNTTNQLVLLIEGEDLAMGLTTSATNLLIGDTVVSWVTVTNLGPATNGPVFITNMFSPNWTNITIQAQGTNLVTNNASGPIVIANLGLLPVGQPVTAMFTAEVLSSGPVAWETATVASQDVDTNLANNSASNSYLVNGENLALGLSASSAALDLGQPITYTINVTNLGLSYSGMITVSSAFSTNLAPVSATQSQGVSALTNNQVVFNLGVLGAGEAASMTVSALAVSGPAWGTNAVSVSSTDYDPILANNGLTNVAAIYGEDLSVSLSASPTNLQVGQTVTFTGRVTNLGPSTNAVALVTNTFSANLGTINVLQPAGNYTISNQVAVIHLGPLGSGQSVPFALTAIPTSAGTGSDTAAVGGSAFDANAANNTAKANITITPALPMISNLVVTATASSALIAWKTGAPATDQARYGVTSGYGGYSGVGATPATQHVVLLTGLAGGTTYYFQALSWVGSTLYTTNGSFSITNALILNTQDAHYTGLWNQGSVATGIYGVYYQFATTTFYNSTAWAVYDPYIPATGLYNVYIWHPENASFTTNAQLHVTGATNEFVLSVNQTVHGGGWQPVATNLFFTAGTNGNVTLFNDTGDTNKYVVANAMMWVYNPAQDDPGNGVVPAWWANYFFGTNVNGSVNGSADADGDGYSNYAEYVFGTNPTNPASRLSFTVAPVSSQAVAVTFSPCQGGRTYQLLAATNLASPTWTALTNGFTVNTDGSGTFTVTQTAPAAAFYRLSAQVIP